jgi:hypothetical protein
MRIASIIDGLLGDTQHELEALSKILEQFKEASRIRRRLLPDLKDCRRAGVALQSQIKEDRSNLGDFDKVVDKLDHYIKELEQVAGRASYFLQSDLVIMVRGRSGTEENLDQAARRLQTKLQEVSPTVEVLKLSVHAAASREKQLQEELKDMKLQLASGGSRLVPLYMLCGFISSKATFTDPTLKVCLQFSGPSSAPKQRRAAQEMVFQAC